MQKIAKTSDCQNVRGTRPVKTAGCTHAEKSFQNAKKLFLFREKSDMIMMEG